MNFYRGEKLRQGVEKNFREKCVTCKSAKNWVISFWVLGSWENWEMSNFSRQNGDTSKIGEKVERKISWKSQLNIISQVARVFDLFEFSRTFSVFGLSDLSREEIKTNVAAYLALFNQNAVKIRSKCSQNSVKMQPKFNENAVKMKSKCCQNEVKIQSKWSQNSVKIQPKCS